MPRAIRSCARSSRMRNGAGASRTRSFSSLWERPPTPTAGILGRKDRYMATDDTAARPSVAFPRLDEGEIAALRRVGTPRRLQDGEILVAAGDPAADFFVV